MPLEHALPGGVSAVALEQGTATSSRTRARIPIWLSGAERYAGWNKKVDLQVAAPSLNRCAGCSCL